jgi:hypothetical protein
VSWEYDISCDGCWVLVGGGTHADCLDTLKKEGGRAFVPAAARGVWFELSPEGGDWYRSLRHLCGRCANNPELTRFFDATAIPQGKESTDAH